MLIANHCFQENIEEVIGLQQNLDNLVEGLETVNKVTEDEDANQNGDIKKPQKFQHFPVINVENIYDKNAIETILVDFTDNSAITHDNSKDRFIETNQFDDILLANYLRSTNTIEQPSSLLKSNSNNIETPGEQIVEVINGKVVDRVEAPVSKFPRAEKLVSIPDTVSTILTSVNSHISYDGDQAPPSLPPHLQHPSTTERLSSKDVAIKAHPPLDQAGQGGYVQYVSSPHLATVASTEDPHTEDSEDSVTLVEADSADTAAEDELTQKFWPGSNIKSTYQHNWIGYDDTK